MKIRLFLFLNKTCYLFMRERGEIIIIHKFKGESQSLLVVDTYFHDTFFYKPDSCIVLYIFSFKHGSSLCEYIGEIEGV